MSNKNLLFAAGGIAGNAWDLDKLVIDAGSRAWTLSNYAANANYVGTELSSGLNFSAGGIYLSSDKKSLYILDKVIGSIKEYSSGVPFDTSSAMTLVQTVALPNTLETIPAGMTFKPDGTKVYVVGAVLDSVDEYNLTTAWDISTITLVQSFSLASQETAPRSICFKPDGTKMYVAGTVGDDINEYNLSTPWDVSTASFVQASPSVGTYTDGIFFKPDGLSVYLTEVNDPSLRQYALSTPWDISTISLTYELGGSSTTVSWQGSIFFTDFGSSWIFFRNDSESNERFRTEVIASTELATAANSLFFKPDGTKIYTLTNNAVREHNLSTPWDATTTSFVQSFSVSGQESSSQSLFFSDDGTKMYVIGQAGDDVNEYSLATAWDVSTASYVQNFSVASEEVTPYGIEFRPNGKSMYIIGRSKPSTSSRDGKYIHEYALTTAWDVSTASFVKKMQSLLVTPFELRWKPDGTQLFVLSYTYLLNFTIKED